MGMIQRLFMTIKRIQMSKVADATIVTMPNLKVQLRIVFLLENVGNVV